MSESEIFMRAFTLGVGRTVVLRMLGIGDERQEWEVGTGWAGGWEGQASLAPPCWLVQASGPVFPN